MINASAAGTVRRLLILAGTGLAAAGCSGNPGRTSAPQPPASPSASAPAVSAPAVSTAPAAGGTETPPPGDIPDSTVYVAYRHAAGNYVVKVPQGWAQTVTPSAVSFTDKLNSITIAMVRGPAPTLASARATDVPQLQGSVQRFALAGISTVTRPAGSVVLIRYSGESAPDPVTGKVYMDSVERYDFYRNGIEAVVTLRGPAGADNVDPWRTVTDSFRWLR
jgi:hypothetical protein